VVVGNDTVPAILVKGGIFDSGKSVHFDTDFAGAYPQSATNWTVPEQAVVLQDFIRDT
jgi:hypothetical protein